jgi:hypothetical protein
MGFIRAALVVLALGLAQGQTTNVTTAINSTSSVQNVTNAGMKTNVTTVTDVSANGVATAQVTGENTTIVTSANGLVVSDTIILSAVNGVTISKTTTVTKNTAGAVQSSEVATKTTQVDKSSSTDTATTTGSTTVSIVTTVTAPSIDTSNKTSITKVFSAGLLNTIVTTTTSVDKTGISTESNTLNKFVIVTSADGRMVVTSA